MLTLEVRLVKNWKLYRITCNFCWLGSDSTNQGKWRRISTNNNKCWWWNTVYFFCGNRFVPSRWIWIRDKYFLFRSYYPDISLFPLYLYRPTTKHFLILMNAIIDQLKQFKTVLYQMNVTGLTALFLLKV